MIGEILRGLGRRISGLPPEGRPLRLRVPYAEVRELMRPGDVLLFEGRGLGSAAIRWKTGSYRTHAGIVDVVQGLSGPRVIALHSREWRGVLVDPVSALVRKGERIGWFRHVAEAGVRVDAGRWELPPVDRERLVAWAWDRVGDPYDWSAIGRIVRSLLPWSLPLSPVDGEPIPRRAICSAYVSGAVLAGGRDLVPHRAEATTTPADLEASALLRYSGELVP